MHHNRAINSWFGDSRGVLIYALACQYPPEGYFPVGVIREPARASYSFNRVSLTSKGSYHENDIIP